MKNMRMRSLSRSIYSILIKINDIPRIERANNIRIHVFLLEKSRQGTHIVPSQHIHDEMKEGDYVLLRMEEKQSNVQMIDKKPKNA